MSNIAPHTLTSEEVDGLRDTAAQHLWRHFSTMADAASHPLPIITHGEGCYLIDAEGRRYLDGTSQLICVQVGYSYGDEFAEAAAAQYRQIGYLSNFGRANPRAIELAAELARLAPDGMNHVWFTPSGAEGIETCWKLARQYFQQRGKRKWKAIARHMAYHGTTMGALSLMGVPELRAPFAPLVPGARFVRNTLRKGRDLRLSEEEFTADLLKDLENAILAEDPETVAMIVLEPVQNHGGCLVPPAGYMRGVRALCDTYDILLVSDETMTGFGRMGAWFASTRYDMEPDLITVAKGLSSSQAVIGAVIAKDALFDEFYRDRGMFVHGSTFSANPVAAAVALKNLEIMQRLDLVDRVVENESVLAEKLEALRSHDCVSDTRGAGYMWAVELATHTLGGRRLEAHELSELYGPRSLGWPLEDRGVMLRLTEDAGEPILFVAPPLIAGPEEFDIIVEALGAVLTDIDVRYSALT
jgi:adenosylmethionine-8-amino-7-oxononanoate aminotransferase